MKFWPFKNRSLPLRETLFLPKKVLIASVILFLTFLTLRAHQFSFDVWKTILPQGTVTFDTVGHGKDVRSDDWFAELPARLAQVHTSPPFSVLNEKIGLGERMPLNATQTPVLHYTAPFHPTMWGYFLGGDIGMAWNWWSLAFGIILSSYFLLSLIAPGCYGASLFGALFIYFMPANQFWSLHYCETLIFTNLVLICLFKVAEDARAWTTKKKFAWSFLLFYALVGFMLNLYPPFQVPFLWLAIFLFVAKAVETRRSLGSSLPIIAFSSLLAILFVAAFFFDERETFLKMTQTVYPGERFETGGNLRWWSLFSSTLFTHSLVKDWRLFATVYGHSSYMFFSIPLILAYLGTSVIKARSQKNGFQFKFDPYVTMLVLFLLFTLTFMCIGFPPVVAKFTLMSKVIAIRAIFPLGFAFALLTMRVWYLLKKNRSLEANMATLFASMLLWVSVLTISSSKIYSIYPELNNTLRFGAVTLCMLISVFVAFRKTRTVAFFLAFSLTTVSMITFNPLMFGGTKQIQENVISQEMLKAHTSGSRWLVYGDLWIANLPRMLGLNAINGTHSTPQFELWSLFDETGAARNEYNRFAHVFAYTTSRVGETKIKSNSWNTVDLGVHPLDPRLLELKVDHFLVVGAKDQEVFEANKNYFLKHFSMPPFYIYSRARGTSTAAP